MMRRFSTCCPSVFQIETGLDEEERELTPTATGLMAESLLNPGDTTQGKKFKVIDYHSVGVEARMGLDAAMSTEWEKYREFNAVVPCAAEEVKELIALGHSCIPQNGSDQPTSRMRTCRGNP